MKETDLRPVMLNHQHKELICTIQLPPYRLHKSRIVIDPRATPQGTTMGTEKNTMKSIEINTVNENTQVKLLILMLGGIFY